jgi:hypothetical protein
VIAFVKYADSETIFNWIRCLNEALAKRVPPRSMDVLTFENSDHALFWRHSLRSLPSTPATLMYPVLDPANERSRFPILVSFLRQWHAVPVVLAREDISLGQWSHVIAELENLGSYYIFGCIPENPPLDLGQQLIATLDSGWYGRYNWSDGEKNQFFPVSRVPYVNSANSLDWAKS